jgi:hypothetical protein
VNAAEAAVATALAEMGDVAPEVPTHGQEMAETGLDVLPVTGARSS